MKYQKRFIRSIFTAAVCAVIVLSANADVLAATPSPLVELTLGPNTKVYGLTALDSLGKKTGTLEEFANSIIDDNTKSYTLFPANFFNAYEDTREVFGGIYSQGEIIFDSWLDYGCGFDINNDFYMFKLVSYISVEKDGKIITQNTLGQDVEILTAFECYPWLIQNSAEIEIRASWTPLLDAGQGLSDHLPASVFSQVRGPSRQHRRLFAPTRAWLDTALFESHSPASRIWRLA